MTVKIPNRVKSYEQYIEGYNQWKKDRDNLYLQELYNRSTDHAERKALARAMYQIEVK